MRMSDRRDGKELSEHTREPYSLSVTDFGTQIEQPWSPKSCELRDPQFKTGGYAWSAVMSSALDALAVVKGRQ
jgi:hypothetical protein